MSQRDILEVLEEDKWIRFSDIEDLLPFLSKRSISKCIQRLRKSGELDFKNDPERKHGYLYKVNVE